MSDTLPHDVQEDGSPPHVHPAPDERCYMYFLLFHLRHCFNRTLTSSLLPDPCRHGCKVKPARSLQQPAAVAKL